MCTGFCEEVFFRGFLLKRFEARFGFLLGNTLQGFLFGLLHGIPFGITTGKVMVTILLTVLPGTLGWLNEKGFNGSIFPSWLVHGILIFVLHVWNYR
ncbi:MAG: CPBP family intramembrane metalloprotease [Clostridiales bacterium]|nr:CPBP family intramembrane metalloprotease [Clostridiales bacterium]